MEHIPEKKTQLVTLPASLLKALYALQKEPTQYEWGGGIDFEIIAGSPQVERILAYFGEKKHIPSRVLRKYGRDIEVTFHTHPRQKRVQPSAQDITSFVRSPAQVSMIIAGEEIGLLEKRADFEILIKDPPSISLPVYYDPETEMPIIKAKLNRIGINVFRYPRGVASPIFNLEIVRRVIGEEHATQGFEQKEIIAQYAKQTPDIDDPREINYWRKEDDMQIYVEGWCNQCFAGAGLGEYDTQGKLTYAADLTPKILQTKAKEKDLILISGDFVETPDKNFLYGVTVGIYKKHIISKEHVS